MSTSNTRASSRRSLHCVKGTSEESLYATGKIVSKPMDDRPLRVAGRKPVKF